MNDPNPDPARWQQAGRWFAKATTDLEMARWLMQAQPLFCDGAAYHCQQAAEKLLKGLLVAGGGRVPRIHDLRILVQQARGLFPALAAALTPLAAYTGWGIHGRYPGDDDDVPIAADAILTAVAEVETAWESVRALVPADPA